VAVRKPTRLTVVTVALSTLLSLVSHVGHTQDVPSLSEVTATVFDETGAVIPDCEIVFRRDSQPIVKHTGADGAVVVRLPSGRYSLMTSKAGFVKNKILDVQIVAPTPDSLRIVLKAECAASGISFVNLAIPDR